MATNISNTWWESYRNTVEFTKTFRELVSLVDDREDVAQSMISWEKSRYPGKSEIWYANKLINELKNKRFVSTLY
jgi:hypothetical protein